MPTHWAAPKSDSWRVVNMEIDTCDIAFIGFELKIIQIDDKMFQSKYFRCFMQSNVLISSNEFWFNSAVVKKLHQQFNWINGIFGSTSKIIRSIPQKPRTQTIPIENHPNLVSVLLCTSIRNHVSHQMMISCPCAFRFAVFGWRCVEIIIQRNQVTLIIIRLCVWGEKAELHNERSSQISLNNNSQNL